MNQENNSFDNLPSSQDDIQIQVEGSTTATTITSTSFSSDLTVPKTARDKFFKDLQHEPEKKRWSAECLLCKKSKRTFDKLGVTSNFTRHVRECHKQAFDKWLCELNETKPISPKKPNKITKHFAQTSRATQRSTYGTTHPRQVELSTSVVNDLIIKLALPLSIVERPAFINFMKTVDPKFTLTSRRTLTRTTIPSLYTKMHDQLKSFCSTATFLSLALDIWSDRRLRSFFAVTADAIVDGNFKSYVLGFIPLWGSHCGPRLLQQYEDIINTFSIKDKVIRLVTDSSSNNINAFKDLIIPGFEQYFIQDDDEVTDEDSDGAANGEPWSDEYDEPESIASTITCSSTAEPTKQDLIRDSFRNLLDNNEVFRIPCFAHTIQLVVKDGLNETKSILSSLEKVSAIAKLSHTCTKFAEKLELMKVSIPRAVVTRWNSQFLLVERILAIPSFELNEILIQLKYKNMCLSSRDLIALNEFLALLSLLAEVTTKIQQQNFPSISLVAPSILAIYFDLKNEKSNVQYTTPLCHALLSSLLSRFGGLLEKFEINLNETGVKFEINRKFYDLYKDPVFIFSPFLDGMFKLNWINDPSLPDPVKERVCDKIKQLILDQGILIEYAYSNYVPIDTQVIQEQQQQQQMQSGQTSNTTGFKRKYLFSNIQNDSKHQKKKPADQYKFIPEEMARYLNDNDNDSMMLLQSTASISIKHYQN